MHGNGHEQVRGNNRQKYNDKFRAKRYPGTVINNNCDNNKETRVRFARGNKNAGNLNAIIGSKIVSRSTKVKLYKIVIRPKVTYVCDTWTLNKTKQQKFEAWERKTLRTFYE